MTLPKTLVYLDNRIEKINPCNLAVEILQYKPDDHAGTVRRTDETTAVVIYYKFIIM